MPTAIEKGRELEQKRGELSEFLKTRQTANGLDMQGDDIKSFNDRNAELSALNDEFVALDTVEKEAKKNEAAIKSWNMPDREGMFGGTFTQGGGGTNWNGTQSRAEIKTFGQMFVESDEFKEHGAKAPSATNQLWRVALDATTVDSSIKAIYAGTLPNAMTRAGVIDFPTRRPALRDQVPVGDLGNDARIQFIRQNVQIFGADTVPQGALKPETTLGTEPVNITVEAVAHYIKVPNQALKFIPGTADLIDRKGTQGILLAEDDKMLNYDGANGWKGFLKQTGVQSSLRNGADQFTAFHQMMNQVMFTGYGNVTGFVMNNNDWHKLVCLKDANGRFLYGDPAMMISTDARIWGVRGTVTPVMPEGSVLAGDFVANSKWWTAGGIIIMVGYVNDDLLRNQQTIVVEEYGALEIDIPQTFTVGTGWETIPAV